MYYSILSIEKHSLSYKSVHSFLFFSIVCKIVGIYVNASIYYK